MTKLALAQLEANVDGRTEARKNIPVPLEYAYSALETILLFDGLYTRGIQKVRRLTQLTTR